MTKGEDRFGDLGPGEEGSEKDGRSAAERLEERDRTHPEPDAGPPEVPRPTSRYAWVVGIVMLMIVSVLLLRSIAGSNQGEGVRGPEPGDRLREFAAPSATGGLDGDANVRQRRGGSEGQGKVPACEVRSPKVVNLCELRRKPLVLTFMVTRGADCEPQVDRVERMKRSFPGVNFAVVMSGNEREDAEQIVRRRRWTQPVAVDRDGAVVNVYGVGVCPTTVLALRGGIASEVSLGNLTEAQLRRKIRRLVRRQALRDRRRR
jgi:AhpC/TSA family